MNQLNFLLAPGNNLAECLLSMQKSLQEVTKGKTFQLKGMFAIPELHHNTGLTMGTQPQKFVMNIVCAIEWDPGDVMPGMENADLKDETGNPGLIIP